MPPQNPLTTSRPGFDQRWISLPLLILLVLIVYNLGQNLSQPMKTIVSSLEMALCLGSIGFIWSIHLRSSRRMREERVFGSSQSLDTMVVANLPLRIFLKDTESRFLWVNEAFATALGLCPKTVIGKTDSDLHPFETVRSFHQTDRIVLDSGRPVEVEEELLIEGKPTIARTTKVPVRNVAGEIVAVLGIFEDIKIGRAHV